MQVSIVLGFLKAKEFPCYLSLTKVMGTVVTSLSNNLLVRSNTIFAFLKLDFIVSTVYDINRD